MTFSISLPSVLSKTIGLNDLGELYDCLLGLGITIVIDLLKWEGQYPRLSRLQEVDFISFYFFFFIFIFF